MKQYRMNRLFNAQSGRCIDVAIDHGFFNEGSFLAGIEDLPAAVATIVKAKPDAVQLTVGQARLLQESLGRDKPALVLRTDVANVYGRELSRASHSTIIDEAVEQALRLDAACVVVNLFGIPGEPEIAQQCISNICRLKAACDRFCMPLMVEPLVFRPNAENGGYMVDGDPKKIVPLVRQAVELGADIIKADPTERVDDYPRVIETASRIPVLVRGGGRVSDQEILERTVALMKAGASGIVYGRNIIQHAHPIGITRALMAVVHANASAEEATKLIAA